MWHGLFHWSRLSEIYMEHLVARYTVAGVPVVFHVQAPQVQVDVPVVAVVIVPLEQVDLPEVLVVHVPPAQVDVLAALVVQVSLGCCGGDSALTIADRCEICTCPGRRAVSCEGSAAVDLETLQTIPWYVRLGGIVQAGFARDALRYHAVDGRGRSRASSCRLPAVGTLRRYHPSGSMCAQLVGRVFRMKCLTCLRGASGGSLLAYGLQLVWSEKVGGGSGSDPGGAVSHLAQISLSVVIWVGHFEHHTARSDTPCREKPRSGLPAWEELLAVDERGLLVWCCERCSDVPLFLGCCGVVVKCFVS